MSSVLKGNFKTEKKVTTKPEDKDREARYEQEAAKRLGGSIAYVAKKRVMWDKKVD
jgi:hypothetical protein